ncbi:MAG: non-lysosomal glucosylceramidase, partial [Rhodospirillales bacterium]|nr:non-lysosomal glucosylceramidase [Rhodospirillales bacterium]
MPSFVGEKPSDAAIIEALNTDSDETLAVKGLSDEWIRLLDKRGEPVIYTRGNSADFDYIGMPIGGICAGQLYLGGDGKLWCWDIFNTKSMRDMRGVPTHMNPYKRSEPDTRAHHQVIQNFALRLTMDGKTVTKTLDREGFKDITFHGRYPIGEVTYEEAGMPVRIELEAFSPFIPLDIENSVYPATIMTYTVINTSDQPVSAELVGWLENAVCIDSRSNTAGQLHNAVRRGNGLTMISFTAGPPAIVADESSKRDDILFENFEGELKKWTIEGDAFSKDTRPNFHQEPLRGHRGKRLADSFHNDGKRDMKSGPASDAHTGKLISKPFSIERKAIKLLVGGGRHKGETCVNLIVDGKVVRSATGMNSETLEPKVFNVSALQGKQAHLEIIDSHTGGWGHVLVDHIVFSDDMTLDASPLEDLPDFGSMALAVLGESDGVVASASYDASQGVTTDAVSQSGSFDAPSPLSAVGRKFTLQPDEKTEVRFVLAWYFPNAPRFPISTQQGRYYGTRFRSAAEVAQHITDDYDKLCNQTRLWRDTWYDSTLPHWFVDRTFLNTSILATNTCYMFRDGRFYGYEGVYHGHGTCNHVWGYVQAPGRLFPVLEQRLREMVDYKPGVGFDGPSGRIYQRSEQRRDDAVDGQSGAIFRTYLVHQMQPDDTFLKRVYPSVKKAMNYLTNRYDADRDGILTG